MKHIHELYYKTLLNLIKKKKMKCKTLLTNILL